MSKATKFLLDQPEENDEFGPHQRLAALIQEDIVSSDRGHAIGLVGEWGAGKSTVVSILEKQLAARPGSGSEVTIFKYDAWAHQGDPLRRSFLDDMIAFLREKTLLSDHHSRVLLARIWDRVEETTTSSEPILRPHAAWLVLSALLVPLGGVIESLVKVTTEGTYVALPTWVHLIAAALMLAPLLLALFFVVVHYGARESLQKAIFGADYKHTTFKLSSAFVEKVSGKRELKTVRTAQDSVIEFRQVFDEMIEMIVKAKPNWRFVIVIDNIDRLPGAQARSFWGTMTTFFEGVSRASRTTKKYWLVVPFSPTVLAKVFDDDGHEQAAKGFVDKTFDMVLRVPPPVLSNWRRYLLTKLKEAFPEHTESDLREVQNIYDIFNAAPGTAIIPRQLKLFVNELVALYRQRRDEIQLPLLAAYLLRRDKIGNNGVNLLGDTNVLIPREKKLLPTEGGRGWTESFAALYFDVKVEDGLHFLMQEPVRKALVAGDVAALQSIQDTPGFIDVLAGTARAVLAESETGGLGHLINAAACIGALKEAGCDALFSVWAELRKFLALVQGWESLTEAPAVAFKAIIANSPEPLRAGIGDTIAALMPKATVPELELSPIVNIGVKNWLDAANSVIDFGIRPAAIQVPGGGLFCLEVLQETVLAVSEKRERVELQFDASPELITSQLASEIAAGRCVVQPVELVAYVAEKKLPFNWLSVRDACVAKLKSESLTSLECSRITQLLLGLRWLTSTKGVNEALTELALSGHLFHWLEVFKKDNKTTAALLLVLTYVNPQSAKNSDFGQSGAGHAWFNSFAAGPTYPEDVLAEVARLVRLLQRRAALLNLAALHPNIAMFVEKVVASLMTPTDFFSFEAATIVERQGYLETAARNFDVAALLNEHLLKRPELIDLLVKSGFNLDHLPLYCWLAPKDVKSGSTPFTDFLWKGIEEIPKEEWKEVVRQPEYRKNRLIELFDLLGGATTQSLGLKVEDAIAEYIREVGAAKSAPPDATKNQLRALCERLEPGMRDNLSQNILDDLAGQIESAAIKSVVDTVGFLLTAEAFAAGDVSRRFRRLLYPLLNDPDVIGMHWASGILEKKPELLGEVTAEVRAELQVRLAAARDKEVSSEVRSLIEKACEISGVPLKQSEAESKDVETLP